MNTNDGGDPVARLLQLLPPLRAVAHRSDARGNAP